jgi:glycine cleavage system transcriptional repressor
MADVAVLMAIGNDKPGIVDELSQFLLECGANITESRSVNLYGAFALLLAIQGEPAALQRVRDGLAPFAAGGLTLRLRESGASQPADTGNYPFVLTAAGTDQAGVLHKLSHLLRALNINIDELETHVHQDESFQIRLALSVPREIPVAMLRDYLSYLCNELKITWHLTEA